MKLKIAVCDDEQDQSEYLAGVVSEWSRSNSHEALVRTFPSAEAFLFENGSTPDFDIILIDVEMNAISGIDLAKHLRGGGCRAEIVFVTSHFEFAGEGYEVDALHYLTKPIDEEKLCRVLTKAVGKLSAEPPSVVIAWEGGIAKLYESEILYAEAFLHYISVRTDSGEYRVKDSISAFGGKLSGDFYRSHRSYIVNLKRITRISRTSVTLDSGAEIPLARGKYDGINRAFIERN